eukprot:TRINITY_DN2383_c0_g2_i2.p1 TRINITY_DN2383_c0_g2~~TRINITY_DN2383_c0_g2_i2.p1  ORF type:complete len:564 (-),score=90.00 TRINITY_DN2383_c0_g2_i2:2-1693(-)
MRMPVENEYLVVQSSIPLLPLPIAGSNIGYYEVTIENFGIESSFCIGLAPKGFNRSVVGVGLYSVGIAADCTVYIESPYGRNIGNPFNSGDCVGVGINFDTKQFFLTRNGEYMFSYYLPQLDTPNERYYPSISLNSFDECLTINFGEFEDWKFDIFSMCISNNTSFVEYSKIEYPEFLCFGQPSITEESRKGYEDKLKVFNPMRMVYYHCSYLVEDFVSEEFQKEEVNQIIEDRVRYIGSQYQFEGSDDIKIYYRSLLRQIEFILLDSYVNIVNSLLNESITLRREKKFKVGDLDFLYGQFQVLLTLCEQQIPFNNPVKFHMVNTDLASMYQVLTGEKLNSSSVEQIYSSFMVYCRYLMTYHISVLKEGKRLADFHPDENYVYIRGSPVNWVINTPYMNMINEYKDGCDVIGINRNISTFYGIILSPFEDMEELKDTYISIGKVMMEKSNEAEAELQELRSIFQTQDKKTLEKMYGLEDYELDKESMFLKVSQRHKTRYQEEIQSFIDSIDPPSEFYRTQTISSVTTLSNSSVLKKVGLVLLGFGTVAALGGLGYFLYKRSKE